ncbi:MAG: phosphoribosylamine--glycine ligase [Thermovirgaceae bacterium]
MRLLLLGNGAREHALAWALNKSPFVDELHCMPGNGGIGQIAEIHEGNPEDVKTVCRICEYIAADMVIVGPEAPLVAGIADALAERGIPAFGPRAAGAKLEGSKAFAKEFMARHNIPTADFDICRTMKDAKQALAKRHAPYIVKANGLAAGKGVFVLKTREEALDVSRQMLEENLLQEAGRTLVIEDHLPGKELTVLVITDGITWKILPPSQDHKRVFDGDQGPNTGGMGAFCPVPWITEDFLANIEAKVVSLTIRGLASEGVPFTGVLYCGLMLGDDGTFKVLEYNVRLGDPETQVVLPVFPGDFAEAAWAACHGDLASVSWKPTGDSAVGVVMASGGYPGHYEKGFEITGLESLASAARTFVFHAGTRKSGGRFMTNGGRVLTVVGTGGCIGEARKRAYDAVGKISFKHLHYRKDIAAFAQGE